MTTISGIANGALSALRTYTAAISVSNTNIANAETDSYCRQEAVIQTQNGTVTVTTVKRICSSFATAQLRSATESLGKATAVQSSLASVEEVFSDSDDYGLSAALSDFWSAWEDLVNDPSGSTERATLASAANVLAETFNSMSESLSDIQDALDDSVAGTVSSINDLVQEIAEVNEKIAQAKAAGMSTNSYEDTMDALVLELSSLVDINTYTNDTGQTCVQLSDGRSLVEGTNTWSLSTEVNSATGLLDVVWVDSGGETTVITDDIDGGELGGYLEVRDDVIPEYLESLDELAASIIEQVNSLQTAGYDLNGDAGVSFFSGTDAASMAVHSEILDDPDKIAAASTADGGIDDGSNASAIADLQDSLVLNGGTSTFSDYYSALVARVGSAVDSANAEYELQSDTVEICQNQRDSVSAVDTDEELINLELYQSAYEAAAKVMTILDELMETIIEMVD